MTRGLVARPEERLLAARHGRAIKASFEDIEACLQHTGREPLPVPGDAIRAESSVKGASFARKARLRERHFKLSDVVDCKLYVVYVAT